MHIVELGRDELALRVHARLGAGGELLTGIDVQVDQQGAAALQEGIELGQVRLGGDALSAQAVGAGHGGEIGEFHARLRRGTHDAAKEVFVRLPDGQIATIVEHNHDHIGPDGF